MHSKYGYYESVDDLVTREEFSRLVDKLDIEFGNLLSRDILEYILIDASPGIGCPVIASVVGSDYVIAVTEPTPSGLADLKRALQVVEYFGIPYSIIINRYDINKAWTEKIEDFAKKKGAKIKAYDPVSMDNAKKIYPDIKHVKGPQYRYVFFLNKIEIIL